jgi:5-methylcytosine-specific restriction endonuclease McrA
MLPRPCLTCGRLCHGTHCPEHAPPTGRGSTRAWRTLREGVLERAGGRCERCGAPARDIHHLEPVYATGRADSENPELLQALCLRCHRATHA